jgi:signal transduction histidine kinase
MRQEQVCPIETACVITGDSELYRACQQVLRQWDVAVLRSEGEPDFQADLWIWDCRVKGHAKASANRDLKKCIFLVGREDLVNFPEDILLFAAAVALLPIDEARLRIACEQALARQDSAEESVDSSCRPEKDALLQCVLQANLKLQEYDQDRTNFLNRALHDFRAPLTSIAGYAGILASGQIGVLPANQAELVERIHGSAKRLSRLVDGMFQLGVRRFKQTKPELIKGDLPSTLEIALGEVEAFVAQKQLAISVRMDEPDGELFFEPEPIVQVLVNILENACRFSPKRSAIQISGYPYFWDRRSRVVRERMGPSDRRSRVAAGPNSYRIDISDSGPGILPEHLGTIFEEYTSYSGSRDRSGTGLGLAICRGIIDLHEGRIWAESKSAGATFSFLLPYASRRAERELARAAGAEA